MESATKQSRAKGNFNEKLTLGETLFIWRRRKNWTQLQAAKYYNVSYFRYSLAEYDKVPNFPMKKTIIGQLQDNERCVLYRRRMGKTQSEIASKVGIGKLWLRLQELGQVPCGKLLNWWENYG